MFVFVSYLLRCNHYCNSVGNTMKNRQTNTTLSEHVQSPIEKYHTVGTRPTSNRKMVETRDKIDTPNTHYLSIFYWLGSGIVIKS